MCWKRNVSIVIESWVQSSTFCQIFCLIHVCFSGQNNQCSREYLEVELSRIKDKNCPSINEITQEPPLKIKCLKGNCTLWCEKFARCLHQSDKWQKKCARKFQKLFRGHRRTKIKVHAKENQSSLQIRVKFCEWKSRYKVYTIESLDSVSEENGMY